MTAPLVWPEFWLKRTPFRRFLVGLPFVGLQEQTRDFIAAQLVHRSADTLLEWVATGLNERLVTATLTHIARGLRWPNAYFIPADPLEIVLFDANSVVVDDLTVDEILTGVENEFRVKPGNHFWSDHAHAPLGETLADLAALSSASARG